MNCGLELKLKIRRNSPVVSIYMINTVKTLANDNKHDTIGRSCRNGEGLTLPFKGVSFVEGITCTFGIFGIDELLFSSLILA